ncbi:NUDIX domain-containing protein [Emticicia sp. 21SJ11W-3]|uniref:NUDIX hydrolase n=1 Tax=Emticicia sp. 21SJ11W-3 TaxID=2916755 RepID=UPI00209DE273|nr:NUDIX domain-containing protein [Emticicia sp. 21SJ11W-3]UTA67932.1 NUDIX domain-containing protein [Emticicia sp. 21SJ11W-3]
MKKIDKLAWIRVENRKILSTRSKGKDVFYFPGGKRELDESDEAALLREIQEELTVDLLPDSLRFFGKFEAQAHGHAEGTLVIMTCYEADYKGTLTPAAEIDEIAWLGYADRLRSSAVDQLIFRYLKERDLID